jgi:hypothetical protein
MSIPPLLECQISGSNLLLGKHRKVLFYSRTPRNRPSMKTLAWSAARCEPFRSGSNSYDGGYKS